MGFIFGILKTLTKWFAYTLLFATLIILIPNLPPYADFTSIILEPTIARTGPLAPNELLNNAQQLYKDKLLGPEALQVYEGEVYTSLATGEIVKLSPGGHVTFVTKVGQPCKGHVEEEKCGRPLDFKIDEKEKKLIVADAYYGIWKVDLKTDKKQLLVSPLVEIEGRVPKLFNGVALDKNGDFFWTDSCSDFQLKDGAYCTLTDPSGRLFHYNAAKNSSRVLVDNLWFANGVAVSPDRQFVVVAETAAYRLVKHYIDGPKKGRTEEFIAGLPGLPDNVRALPDGSGALVALYAAFDDEHPLLLRSLAPAPAARKLLARVQRLVEIPFEFLNAHLPHAFFQQAVNRIGNFQTAHGLLPPLSGLVHVGWDGRVVAAYYNTDESVAAVSDAVVVAGRLYLGAPHSQAFVAAVDAPEPLRRAFVSPKEAPKAAPKVQEPPARVKPVETPKPTTPKPVTEPKAEPSPKPTQAPKPTTPPPKTADRPTPSPKKVENPAVSKQEKQAAPSEREKPQPTPPKPTESKPKSSTPKPAEAKPITTPPKPTTTPPKPTETKPKAAPKPAEPKEDKVKKTTPQSDKTQAPKDKLPEKIPVEEKIVSDTAKPKKESLKVIKKEGPAEIPNVV